MRAAIHAIGADDADSVMAWPYRFSISLALAIGFRRALRIWHDRRAMRGPVSG